MKFKVSIILLSAVLLSQNVSVFADDDFNAKDSVESYSAYDYTTQKALTPIVGLDNRYVTGDIDYYDTDGNIVSEPKEGSGVSEKNIDTSCNDWAKESIDKAIELGLVPENLQSNYTQKITRAEFCRLAMQTYIAKTKNQIDTSAKTPFTDVDDYYITNAYNMKIIAGVGNNKFAPDNNITRQEAAVMLNNLATVLNVDTDNSASNKFVDESYFADWAKSAIYSVVGIKSGDTYVMVGTGNGKFSPWMNYTREQAIATMLRLYNCETKEMFYDGQYKQMTEKSVEKYGDFLFYTYTDISGDNMIGKLIRYDVEKNEKKVIDSAGTSMNLFVDGDYLYYIVHGDYESKHYKMKLDLTEKTEITSEECNDVLSKYDEKKAHNDKYNFYYTLEFFAGKSCIAYPTRSDLNGDNETRLYNESALGDLILYDDHIYFNTSTQGANNIVRLDFDGNFENVTHYQNDDDEVVDIVKIENGKIYYLRSLYNDTLYSINVDGTDEKLLS